MFILVVPVPSVALSVPGIQIVGQPLTLECSVTTVRGITNGVDVVWRKNGIKVDRRIVINYNSTSKDMLVFTNLYTITQLSTSDQSTTYQCETLISTSHVVPTSSRLVILNITGMCMTIVIKKPKLVVLNLLIF